MTEEEIKLPCAGVELKKPARGVDEESSLAPGLIKFRGPSEPAAVTRARRRTRVEAYFAAMEDLWDE